MIINSSKIKSEALLLLCRELIISYQNSNQDIFKVSDDIKNFANEQTSKLQKAINVVVKDNDYYIRNSKVSRISMILKTYNYLDKNLSKKLSKGEEFNPIMLCFSLLSTWFAELSNGKGDKEYLYFTLYPYSEVYDKLLLNIKDIKYKSLNIHMLNIAEDTIVKLNNYRFK